MTTPTATGRNVVTETMAPNGPRQESSKVPPAEVRPGRLFFLDVSIGGRIVSVNADGSDRRVVIDRCRTPDGIVVDLEAGHIYWTNMGVPRENDGSIERADLDGRSRTTIVASGSTFTPKQLHLQKKAGKLYWSDREGMRVMRCDLDGSHLETLVDSSGGDFRPGTDATRWCVGIAVDPDRGQMYWTQKGPDNGGTGRIFRANVDIPDGENAVNRTDIELLYDGLPEPIDLELDLANRLMYWTDRGDPPRGNTVNRAPMDAESKKRPPPDILVTHLMEGIGIALDLDGRRMFLTDMAGSVYSAGLDGSEKKLLLAVQGNLTGIAFAKISPADRKNEATTGAPIRRVAIVGSGVIGASWSALFLAKGLQVVATDPAPNAEASLRKFVKNAWPALERLGLAPGASPSKLEFTADLARAVTGVDLVQENGPERIDFKQKLYAQLDELLPPEVIIASSSSGLPMSQIQAGAKRHPERCVIAHPFNPPHLIPLVEIVGGAQTSEETIGRARGFYDSIGRRTVRINKELPGHVANRLQAALAREVYFLVIEGVLSAADVDTALSWGPGLRWGIMGNMMLNHLGGGPGGIEHFFEQFAGPMMSSWKALGSPVLTPESQKKLIDSVHAEVGSRSIEELEAERDEILLGLIELRSAKSVAASPRVSGAQASATR